MLALYLHRFAIIDRHEYKVIRSEMAYHRSRSSIRQIYEERFLDEREVTVHRVVSVTNGGHSQEHDPGYADDYWRGGAQNYQETREYYGQGYYPPPDRRFVEDNPVYRRNSPPHRPNYYHQPGLGRHDLRHQLESRSRGRPRSHHHQHYRGRGRGSGSHPRSAPEKKPHPGSAPVSGKRGRSPSSHEQPPVGTRSRSFSPEKDQGPAHQPAGKKLKPSVAPSQSPAAVGGGSTVEDSSHSSASSKNQLPEPPTSPPTPEPLACQERTAAAAAAPAAAEVAVKEEELQEEEEAAGVEEQSRWEEEEEREEEEEEEEAGATEPELPAEERVRARRSDAIKAKALEVTKLYTQDCETFLRVVKMLVAKEPRLDELLLQASLDQNLLEIRQRCLDDLRSFIKELDQVITQGGQAWASDPPPPLEQARSARVVEVREDLPQISFKQEEEGGPSSTGDTGGEAGPPGGGAEEAATPPPERGSSSTPAPSGSPSSPGPARRLQLYGAHGVKLKNSHLFNPKLWRSIGCFRPGWVPERPPFLHGDRYWELRANSTVVSTSPPPTLPAPHCANDPSSLKMPCGVTCYIHSEGPWCEIQAANGTRVCILAAEPQRRA